jgi:hypothetical protein
MTQFSMVTVQRKRRILTTQGRAMAVYTVSGDLLAHNAARDTDWQAMGRDAAYAAGICDMYFHPYNGATPVKVEPGTSNRPFWPFIPG